MNVFERRCLLDRKAQLTKISLQGDDRRVAEAMA
jgi:hypothetical protein